jgi:hypothetical protein
MLEITNNIDSFSITKEEALQLDNAISESKYNSEWYYLANQLYYYANNKINNSNIITKLVVTNQQYNFLISIIGE